MTSFFDELQSWPEARVAAFIDAARREDVDAALAAETCGLREFAALLSERARDRLEDVAQKAQRLTRGHFGRTIGLYAPLYLSNVCGSDCVYCWFAAKSRANAARVTLDDAAIRDECEALAARGFDSVLLLTGEAPGAVPVERLANAVAIARQYFSSVSVEIYALDTEGYRRLCGAGLDGVTLYMETYDPATYERVHLAGKKRDYRYRLDAIERAGMAGARRLNAGALFGLYNWRLDAFWLGLHARYLQRRCWRSAVAVSFPRLRHAPEPFAVPCPVNDAGLVQLMLALRLFLPEAGLTLSTREPAALRDRLIPLGVTLMSAGSSTRPGGYATHGSEILEQFAIEDARPPEAVAAAIRRAGYDPVWKDFDRAFHREA